MKLFKRIRFFIRTFKDRKYRKRVKIINEIEVNDNFTKRL